MQIYKNILDYFELSKKYQGLGNIVWILNLRHCLLTVSKQGKERTYKQYQ